MSRLKLGRLIYRKSLSGSVLARGMQSAAGLHLEDLRRL